MVLKIKKKDLNEMIEFAKRCYPIEDCGILVGKNNEKEKIVEKVYHTKNVLSFPMAYQIDPIEVLKIFEEVKTQNLEILGFYHSHPFWNSFWSKIDEEMGKYWVGYSYLVISLKTGNINAYIKKKRGVEKEEVVINSNGEAGI